LDQWYRALHEAFAAFSPPAAMARPEDWRSWAETVLYDHDLAPAGPMASAAHYHTRERMGAATRHACSVSHFGATLGHDFVMRLGNDGFTPDGLLIGRQSTERLFERYLNGP